MDLCKSFEEGEGQTRSKATCRSKMRSIIVCLVSVRVHQSVCSGVKSAMACFLWILLFFCASLECRKEQWAVIKSCTTWGFDAACTINSVRAAFGDHALSHTQIRHWFRVYQADRTRSVHDAKRSGRPLSQRTQSRIAGVEEVVLEDHRKTTRQIAQETSMSHSTVVKVLRKDLKLRKLAAKFVPHHLTAAQRCSRLDISTTHLATIVQDPGVLNRIVATDQSWFYTYDPRNKAADMQWLGKDDPRLTKCLRARSQKKVMLILFFDSAGIISMDFVEEGTVDSEVYIDSLRRMREAYRCKRPHFWRAKNFHLLQDNAGPHRSRDTNNYFASVEQSLWVHPAYSPDLNPCDFWAFPVVKEKIKGHRFQTVADVETAA